MQEIFREYNQQSEMGASNNFPKLARNAAKTAESANVVGDLMWPIIFCLKLSGHSSLSYDKTNLESVVGTPGEGEAKTISHAVWQYRTHFKSLLFAWSILFAIWMCFGWTSSLVHTFELIGTWSTNRSLVKTTAEVKVNGSFDDPEYAMKLSEDSVKTTYKIKPITIRFVFAISASLAIIQLSELFLAWAESTSLAEFLNSWTLLQKQFQLTFPTLSLTGPFRTNLKRTRNLLMTFYVVIPSIFFFPSYIIANYLSRGLVLLFALIPYAWHLCFVSLMEDVKVMMTYRVLAAAFGLVREGISASLESEETTRGKVKAWRRITHSVRRHVEQAGQSQKSHQLLLIGGCIFLITSSVFILLKSPFRDPRYFLLILTGAAFVVLQIGRLYLKILAANLITHEESLIARELVLMNVSDQDIGIQLEVLLFHNMIVQKPSVICFGNYVSMNKKLLLGVGSQVVTYLIVLLQFTN